MANESPAIAQSDSAQDPGLELLRWHYHPIREGGMRLVAVLAFLTGVPILCGWLYGPFYVLLALIILGGSLGTYFLPTEYALYVGGGETRFIGVIRRFTWDQFRSFYLDRNGVLLSPFPTPSRLENFRGVYLRFNKNGDAVMGIVRERIPKSSPSEEKPS